MPTATGPVAIHGPTQTVRRTRTSAPLNHTTHNLPPAPNIRHSCAATNLSTLPSSTHQPTAFRLTPKGWSEHRSAPRETPPRPLARLAVKRAFTKCDLDGETSGRIIGGQAFNSECAGGAPHFRQRAAAPSGAASLNPPTLPHPKRLHTPRNGRRSQKVASLAPMNT